MENQNRDPDITLIYHNFRGMAHSIRMLLFYLNIPFQQILLDKGETLSQKDPQLSKKVAQTPQLPCLIDGQFIIQNVYAILRHLCTRANREDLLGQNLEQRTLIRQMSYNHLLRKVKYIQFIYKFTQQAALYSSIKQQIRRQALYKSQCLSGSIVAISLSKLKNSNKQFIFSHRTILDFLYFEQTFYNVNLFGNLQTKTHKLLQTFNSIFGTDLYCQKQRCFIYLRVMRQFKEMFQNQPFYRQNQTRLQSYGIFAPTITQQTRKAFASVWLGPPQFLK